MNEVANFNYLIILDHLGDNTISYRYYFIDKSEIVSGITLKLNLTLDIFATYKLNKDFEIDNVITERCHCERFTLSSTINNLTLDISPHAKANNPEPQLDTAFSSTYQTYNHNYLSCDNLENVFLSTEIENDILGWLIIYGNFKITDSTYLIELANNQLSNRLNGLTMPFCALIAPIFNHSQKDLAPYCYYKITDLDKTFKHPVNAREMYQDLKEETSGTVGIFTYYEKENKDSDNNITYTFEEEEKTYGKSSFSPFSIQIVKQLPFKLKDYGLSFDNVNHYFTIDDLGYLTRYPLTTKGTQIQLISFTPLNSSSKIYCFSLLNFANENSTRDYNVGFKFTVAPSDDDELNTQRDITREPKLFKKPYFSLGLRNENTSNSFDYNVFDLNLANESGNTHFTFKVQGKISPTPTGCVYTENIETNGSYYSYLATSKYYFQYADTSNLPTNTDYWKKYVAENKNYVSSEILNAVSGYGSSALSLGMGVASGLSGNALGAVSGATGAFVTAYNTTTTLAKTLISQDNIKSQPDDVKLSGYSYASPLISTYETNGYISYYVFNELKKLDKYKLFDYFYNFGYEVDSQMSSSEWFGRIFFNYVKISEPCQSKIKTNVPMSNEIKNEISNRLLNGIRFISYNSKTNTDNFNNLSLENWERRLIK
ncbi:MAG: hypothetical protein WCR54_07820 [Clostridia bacterium]